MTYLGPTGTQMGVKETAKDTARVLGVMYDGIEYRGFSQRTIEEIAEYAGVPVWNGLTNEDHQHKCLLIFNCKRSIKNLMKTFISHILVMDAIIWQMH